MRFISRARKRPNHLLYFYDHQIGYFLPLVIVAGTNLTTLIHQSPYLVLHHQHLRNFSHNFQQVATHNQHLHLNWHHNSNFQHFKLRHYSYFLHNHSFGLGRSFGCIIPRFSNNFHQHRHITPHTVHIHNHNHNLHRNPMRLLFQLLRLVIFSLSAF